MADKSSVNVGGFGSMRGYASASWDAADRAMMSAVRSVNCGELVDAAMSLSQAKLSAGMAVVLSRTQDDLMKSTLDILA